MFQSSQPQHSLVALVHRMHSPDTTIHSVVSQYVLCIGCQKCCDSGDRQCVPPHHCSGFDEDLHITVAALSNHCFIIQTFTLQCITFSAIQVMVKVHFSTLDQSYFSRLQALSSFFSSIFALLIFSNFSGSCPPICLLNWLLKHTVCRCLT